MTRRGRRRFSDRSGLALWIQVEVENYPIKNWLSGYLINRKPKFGHRLIKYSELLRAGQRVSGSSSRLICRFSLCSCFWHSIIVFYQNLIFIIQQSRFACFAVCDIQYFGICVFCFILSSLPIKAANSAGMSSSIPAMYWIPNMQDPMMLTVPWHSVSSWCNTDVMHYGISKRRHYLIYELLRLRDTWLTLGAIPNIVDAPLTLLFRIRQGECRCCFCHWRQQTPDIWMSEMNCHTHCPRCNTNNGWNSVDTYFQIRAVTVVLALLPMKAANTWVVHASSVSNGCGQLHWD